MWSGVWVWSGHDHSAACTLQLQMHSSSEFSLLGEVLMRVQGCAAPLCTVCVHAALVLCADSYVQFCLSNNPNPMMLTPLVPSRQLGSGPGVPLCTLVWCSLR